MKRNEMKTSTRTGLKEMFAYEGIVSLSFSIFVFVFGVYVCVCVCFYAYASVPWNLCVSLFVCVSVCVCVNTIHWTGKIDHKPWPIVISVFLSLTLKCE